MPSDAEITLAFVAKRQGKDAMPASEWAHVLSLELGWMAPGAAKAFVADAEGAGLLVEDGGALRLSFARNAVDIPNRYRPPEDVQVVRSASDTAETERPPATDLFPDLVRRIAEETSMDKGAVMAEVDGVQERFGGRLSAEAAAVLVALGHRIPVAEDAAAALQRITQDSRPVREG